MARSLLWQAYKRSIGLPLRLRIPGGAQVVCHPDSGSASNIVYFNGLFDYDEINFLLRYLRPGDGALDIGANIGFYTVLMGSLVGPDGFVESFEPFPLSYTRVLENVSVNDLSNVRAHPFAVADAPGTLEFVADMDVSNRIRTEADDEAECIRVQVVRLDDVVAPRRFAFAKLDVEGAELRALQGAESFLAEGNPAVWQVEMMESLLRKQGTSPAELTAHLKARGYRTGYFDEDRQELIYDDHAYDQRLNVLAIHETAAEMVSRRLSGA